MMAFHLDSASFFKPSVEIDKVRTMGSYKLRIIINVRDIRKVSLDRKPETVEELKIKVKEKYNLQDDFNLMSWPALFTERQVFAEFNSIATTNLENDFFGAVDRYTPRFVTIFKSKKGSVGEKLAEIVQQIDSRKPDVTAVRTLVLQGIPALLGDDPSNFYNTSFDSDSDEAWDQVSVGLLTVISEDVPLSPNHLHLDPVSTAIILEGGIVMDNLQNLPQALCLLFGLSYALHLDYPKAMKNTFSFFQRVMLGLGENKLPQTSNS
ncbi:uncharacterized protein LOC120558623 [Perca fluviatilis]|uniref:uncharacterized protein LOC120558623 n=1 Tax=Perca fluviatilis TaxID=8168 RepID=UPI0019635AEE|nr:uncharacterized protein LOC120558623 [Perca fluviatilis]